MSVRLILAPAGSGKTEWALHRARAATHRLEGLAYVCVASRLQVRACRRRLARCGGAMGVHVVTFDGLAAACLDAAHVPYAELDDAVQHRLLRWAVERLDLPYYGRLAGSPGLVQLLQRLVEELAAADACPDQLERALAGVSEPRLTELVSIYRAYREGCRALGCADRVSLVSMARDAVATAPGDALGAWSLLVVDGFDKLTPAQLGLLQALAPHLSEVVVTLTGDLNAAEPHVWRRFRRAQQEVERALGVRAEPLPASAAGEVGPLAPLEPALRDAAPAGAARCSGVELLEAPDRAAEVREALRWLKERLVVDGLAPGEVALLARDMDAYRPYVLQVAAEMGLPLRLAGGIPLAGVPVIAAILDLLRLTLPAARDGLGPALPRRLVVEAWRSPYWDWAELLAGGEGGHAGPPLPSPRVPGETTGGALGADAIATAIAAAFDAAARGGRVVGGWDQWEEALTRLAAMGRDATDGHDEAPGVDGAPDALGHAPVGEEAAHLLALLQRFVERVSPPASATTFREYVGWLEELIGADDLPSAGAGEGRCDGIVACIRAGLSEAPPDPEAVRVAERDIEALRALKDVLRGLVAAEALLAGEGRVGAPVGRAEFFAELAGALEAARLSMSTPIDRDEVLAADVVAARGIPFRAVAILGLAEGEFPAGLGEDVLLRDADRLVLRERGIALELPTESAEPERFYEAVTRARDSLLLTRPRLADNGAAWAPSPFWEEMRRLTGVEPLTLGSENAPRPHRAASWPELLVSLAAYPAEEAACDWLRGRRPERWAAFGSATRVVRLRDGEAPAGAYDGDLRVLADEFAARYGPLHVWSPSRLEQYRACPFMFFVGSVLHLEPRVEPVEGLDARQLGNIYHRLFEGYYGGRQDGDLDAWVARVAEPILEEAPIREGFRETAWWPQTRAEILHNLLRSIEALDSCSDGYVEVVCEQSFGGDCALVVRDGDDALRVRGFIDRVDRRADGGVRVVDYKTAGKNDFSKRAVAEGKKLQLPLYALAARDALGLGEPLDGFYWHVRQAEPSGFTLAGFDGGPEAAFAAAIEAAWQAVRAVRGGVFTSHPPRGGCPSYCPAASFCWRYRPGFA